MNKYDGKDLRQCFEEIEVPRELDFYIEAAVKKGKRKKLLKAVNRISIAFAACSAVFMICIGMMPAFAARLENIPGLSGLTAIVELKPHEDKTVQTVNSGLTEKPDAHPVEKAEEKKADKADDKEKKGEPSDSKPENTAGESKKQQAEAAAAGPEAPADGGKGEEIKSDVGIPEAETVKENKTVALEDNKIDIEYVKTISKRQVWPIFKIDEIKLHMEKNLYEEIGINLEDDLGSIYKSVKQDYDRNKGIITVNFNGCFMNERELYLVARVIVKSSGQDSNTSDSSVNRKELFRIKIN